MTDGQKVLLDEMLTGDIAAQLRARNHDVIAVVEDPALIGCPDEELLGYAASQERCLVTANVGDFAALSAAWNSRARSHAGLVYVVNRVFPNDRSFVGAMVTALDDLIATNCLPAVGAERYLRRP